MGARKLPRVLLTAGAGAMLAAILLCATSGVPGAATTASARGARTTTSAGATTLYAYAARVATSPTRCPRTTTAFQPCGGATSPTSCPRTTTASHQCTLADALSLAKAGDTVALATPANVGHYLGNWSVSTSGTSSSAPIIIKPAPGVTNPVLDGNRGEPTGCETNTCNGPVLTIGAKEGVDVYDLTFQNGYNAVSSGGAISNLGGSTLSVSGCTFSGNTAAVNGGAIASAANSGGTGALSVSGSTFVGNTAAVNGGAIDNGTASGAPGTPTATLRVSASTFSGNSAIGNRKAPGVLIAYPIGYGGAIDNEPTGTLAVSGSTFSANTAKNGGGTINNSHLLWAAADIFNGPCHEAAGATWNDEGYNVGKDASCLKAGTGDVSHGAGHLGRLAHNGGPTETMLPLAGNTAFGVVPLNTNVKLNGRSVTLCPTIDQRGVHSAAGKACNAGAVQSPAP